MARYTGAVCKLCRREGEKLFLKGDRCYTGKCSIVRRNFAPGQHGQARKKRSEYGTQLREKQKMCIRDRSSRERRSSPAAVITAASFAADRTPTFAIMAFAASASVSLLTRDRFPA